MDWVDYATASARGHPVAFASPLERMSAPAHQIWLVWAPGYQTFGTKCEQIEAALLGDTSLGAHEMFPYAAGVGLLDHLREHGVGALRPRRLTADDPPMVAASPSSPWRAWSGSCSEPFVPTHDTGNGPIQRAVWGAAWFWLGSVGSRRAGDVPT